MLEKVEVVPKPYWKVDFRDKRLISMLWDDIEKYPLLTFDEEQEIGEKMFNAKNAQIKFHKLNGNLKESEKSFLEQEIIQGEEAKNKLVNSNLRLVRNLSIFYSGDNIESFFSNFYAGCIQLVDKAVTKFDYRKGNKFSTYASWWIRKGILENINKGNIKFQDNIEDYLVKYKKIFDNYLLLHGNSPSDDYLLKELDIIPKKLKYLKTAYYFKNTLHEPFPLSYIEDYENSREDEGFDDDPQNRNSYKLLFVDKDGIDANFRSTEDIAINHVFLTQVNINLELFKVTKDFLLNDKYRYVFLHHFILGDKVSLSHIAKDLNCSLQNICQIRDMIITKAKNSERFRDFCIDYLGLRDYKDVNSGGLLD